MLSLALGLAELIPSAMRLFRSDRAADNAEKVIDAARQLTGIDDPAQAVDAIKNDPELQIRMQEAISPLLIAELEAETEQLKIINATMQAEYASNDKYVSHWRPTMGYVVTLTWFMQMTALSIVMVAYPKESPAIIGAMAGLSTMWGIALSILGISVSKRSQDKQVASGQTPMPGIMGAIATRIMSKVNGSS